MTGFPHSFLGQLLSFKAFLKDVRRKFKMDKLSFFCHLEVSSFKAVMKGRDNTILKLESSHDASVLPIVNVFQQQK